MNNATDNIHLIDEDTMCFCRWSTDNFQSDIHCFENNNGGITTHVASTRIVGSVPPLPRITDIDNQGFIDAYQKQLDFIETAPRVRIGLPFDGKTFHDKNHEDFHNRLLRLRKMGYRCPEYAVSLARVEVSIRKRGLLANG